MEMRIKKQRDYAISLLTGVLFGVLAGVVSRHIIKRLDSVCQDDK